MRAPFKETLEQAAAAFHENVRLAAQEGPAADTYLRLGLHALVRLHDRLASGSSANEAFRQQFHRESTEELGALDRTLSVYVVKTLFLAEGANDDEWYELCLRRSAFQFIREDYAGTSVADLIDPDDLADIDTELRKIGPDQGPVPPAAIPVGMPTTHWWWRYPPLETG